MDTYPLITAKKAGESRDVFVKLPGVGVVREAIWEVMPGRKTAALRSGS